MELLQRNLFADKIFHYIVYERYVIVLMPILQEHLFTAMTPH